MKTLAKMLIAGTTLLTLAALPVCAAESSDDVDAEINDLFGGQTDVLNGQVNLNNVWSHVNTHVDDIGEDFGAQTTAVGSTAQIFTFSDTTVENNQSNQGFIGAQTDVTANNIGGWVGIGATALCNGVEVSADPHYTKVNSNQSCGGADPQANINASISNVAGGVGVAGTSVGNQLAVDSNAKIFPVNNWQTNSAPIQTNVNVNIAHVGGPASVTASSVGNTAQIIHY
jgi:hypothetical protein